MSTFVPFGMSGARFDFAVLFDYDGVCANTEPLALTGACHVANTAISISGNRALYEPEEFIIRFPGMNFRRILDVVQKERGFELSPDEINYLVDVEKEAAKDAFKKGLAPTPFILDALQEIRRLSLPVGVISSSALDRLAVCVEATGQREFFPANRIFSAQQIEPPASKPDPVVYLEGAKFLGVDPTRSLAIEDAPHGAESAVGAGIRTLGFVGNIELANRVRVAEELRDAGAWDVIEDFREFPGKLQQFLKLHLGI